MADRWLTVTDACQALGVSERTLRRRIEQDKMESKLEDGRRLILVDSGGQKADTTAENELLEQLRSENEHLRGQVISIQDELNQSRERSDTIILQLTKQLEQSQRLLEYHREPFWRKWLRKRRAIEPERL